jgi:hypothetical protein
MPRFTFAIFPGIVKAVAGAMPVVLAFARGAGCERDV